jgi:hypothetical protein
MREEATIRRGVRNARYAAIPNHVFEDVRLSMEARWLLGYLLSKPDNWTVVLRDIINKGNCGRDKARRMVAELVELGYAQKEQARDGGRFSALSLVIYDEPFPAETVESVASLPQTEIPSTVNPSTVLPSTVNPPLVITDNLENTDCRSERARESDEDGRENRKSVERAFKRAFHRWPTAISDSEPDAFRAWSDLTPDERQSAFEEAQRYIDAAKATGRKHVCSHAIYLREKRWEKLPAKAEATDNSPAQAAPFGKLWGARVYSLLLDGPSHQPGLTPIELGMIESGRFTADHILRDKRAKMGFPTVNEILERAEGRRGVLVPPTLGAVKDKLVLVKVGGDVWQAWEQYHREVGWPWFRNVERLEWAYLPEGGPEGLEEFKAAVRGLGDHDGN